MALAHKANMTLDEFLAWEESQELRHEFVDGEIFAMVGGTQAHNFIIFNLATLLKTLRPRCKTFSESMKLLAGPHSFYPDVLVTCARDDTEPLFIRHPTLIAEVLSTSNEAYDRGKKWLAYRAHLPSLRTYLLVAQDEPRVELFRRSGDGWHCTIHAGLDEVIELSDPPCRMPLVDIYTDVFDR